MGLGFGVVVDPNPPKVLEWGSRDERAAGGWFWCWFAVAASVPVLSETQLAVPGPVSGLQLLTEPMITQQ